MGNPTPTAQNSPPMLVNYFLRQMIVRTNVCSYQKHEHGYTLPSRIVHDYNFIFVTRGKVVWVVAGEKFPLGPGDLVIVPPDVEHHAYSLKRRITLVSIHMLATLPGGQDVFELLSPPRFQRVPSGCAFGSYLRGAETEWSRPQAETIDMLPLWSHLIAHELFRHNAKLGLLRYRAADPLIAGMLEDLEKHIARPVTLEALARRSGFSAQHLNRTFQRVLGVTPLKYLSRLRMERAAELLRDGRLTVSAVAAAVGFDDPYYFSRQFHAHHKISPSAFRDAACSDSPSPGSTAPFPISGSRRKV
jgi:AraC-like DNA-binding protein